MSEFKLGDLVEFEIEDGFDKVACSDGTGYKLEPRARIKKLGLVIRSESPTTTTQGWVTVRVGNENYLRYVEGIRKIG